MRAKQVYQRQATPSLKEIQELWDYLQTSVLSASVIPNYGEGTISLWFTVEGEAASIKLQALGDGKLRDGHEVNIRRCIAAARSQQGGSGNLVPEKVKEILYRNVTGNALKILTSPKHYKAVSAQFPGQRRS